MFFTALECVLRCVVFGVSSQVLEGVFMFCLQGPLLGGVETRGLFSSLLLSMVVCGAVFVGVDSGTLGGDIINDVSCAILGVGVSRCGISYN